MKNVNISKQKLLSILTNNQAQHIDEYNKAVDSWVDRQQAALKSALATLAEMQGDALFDLGQVVLPKPRSHAEDYGRAIRMLELSTDEIINLDEAEYRKLVEDDWEWTRMFKHVTSSYIGDAR